VAYENNEKKMDSVYSKRIRAGKRRTYFFDVRETRGNDYLTITESRKRFDSDGYDRHKIFLYKEDFNKFIKGLGEAVDYVKTELMPDFDFDAFNHDTPYEGEDGQVYNNAAVTSEPSTAEAVVADLTETPIEKIEAETATDNTETPIETNNDTAGNGSAEVAEKW
jgi:Protein of unknown function (DUF3276)